MLIQCEKCQTRYNLDEAKIPGKGAKVTCPTCKNVFIVMKDGSGAAAPAPAAAPAAQPPRPAAPTAPAQPKSLLDSFFDDGKGGASGPAPQTPGSSSGRGIRSWKVRVASGLVYDFTDPATLKTWIAERKVTLADQISSDSANWIPLGTIPNLDAFFGVASSPTNPQMPAAPVFGAPGVPPATGFAPASAGPAAPAFAPAQPPPGFSAPPPVPPAGPAPAGPSLADLFNAPAPGSSAPDPFAGASANPFGPAPAASADPFGGAPASSANPFGPAPAANPATAADPFGAGNGDPFGTAPGAADPFANGANPFAAAPATPAGADPFGASGNNPFGPNAATPFTPAAKPAPPPWNTTAPAAPASAPPPPEKANGNGAAVAAVSPVAAGASRNAPVAKATTAPAKSGSSGLGRKIGTGAAAVAVLALLAGVGLNFSRIKAVIFPNPVPTPVHTTAGPHVVATLDGEARNEYLAGRRYLLSDKPEAWVKAETKFRSVLTKAERNPRATAELLESLSLQKSGGAAVPDETLNKAAGETVSAFKEDPHGVETNRALAQYYLATGHPDQAKTYVDTALAAKPDDAESLYLRAMLEKAADAAKAKADVAAAAAKDPSLPRARRAAVEALAAGSPEQKKAQADLATLEEANTKALAALDGGTYTFAPDEIPRLLPEKIAATPTPTVAPSIAPTATPTALVVATTAAPTPTPKPEKTPKVKASPTETTVAATTPIARASATPVAKASPKETVSLVATAGAEDHYVAGQALAQAGSWDDAVTEFEEAAKASPSSAKYALALGTAQMQTKKYQDAAETLSHLIENDANNAPAHRLLGMIYESTGQTAQACSEFSDFLRLTPRAPQAADVQARVARDGCGG